MDNNATYGHGFNLNAGGVYAHTWENDAINVYFFARQAIPADITAGNPDPSGWGAPYASFPSSNSCNIGDAFSNNKIVFDITLCGDWASSAWTGSGIPGQEQSCAPRTGVSTCEEFIRNNGAAFNEACKCLRY